MVAEAEKRYAQFAIVPLSATQAASGARQHEQEYVEETQPEATGQPCSLSPAGDDEISDNSDSNPEIVNNIVCRSPLNATAAPPSFPARQHDAISVLAEPGIIVDEFEAMDADINTAGTEDLRALSMGLGPLCSLRSNGGPPLTRTGLGNSKNAVLPRRWDEVARSLGEPTPLTNTVLCMEDELLARQIQQETDADGAQELFVHEQTEAPNGHAQLYGQAQSGTAAPHCDLPAWRPGAPPQRHHGWNQLEHSSGLGVRPESNQALLSDAALAMRLQMEADAEVARSVEQQDRPSTSTNNTSTPESNALHNHGRNSGSSASRPTSIRQRVFGEEPQDRQRHNVPRPDFPSSLREEPRDAEDFNSRLWGISAEDGNSDAEASQLNQQHQPSRATGSLRPAAKRHQRRPEQRRPLRPPARAQPHVASDTSSDEFHEVQRISAAEQRVQFAVPGARAAAVATATTTIRYRAGEGGGADGDDSCTICCEAFKEGESLRLLPCFHRYHENCVDRWLQQSRTCPVCKHDITG